MDLTDGSSLHESVLIHVSVACDLDAPVPVNNPLTTASLVVTGSRR